MLLFITDTEANEAPPVSATSKSLAIIAAAAAAVSATGDKLPESVQV